MEEEKTQVAGRVAIVPQGDFDIEKSYERLDMVKYGKNSYVAKKDVYGIYPVDAEFWMQSTDAANVNVATTEILGIVKPDGDTITIDEDGTIRSKKIAGDNSQTYATLSEAQSADAQGKIPVGTTVYILND